jgi:hypothetical protein
MSPANAPVEGQVLWRPAAVSSLTSGHTSSLSGTEILAQLPLLFLLSLILLATLFPTRAMDVVNTYNELPYVPLSPLCLFQNLLANSVLDKC